MTEKTLIISLNDKFLSKRKTNIDRVVEQPTDIPQTYNTYLSRHREIFDLRCHVQNLQSLKYSPRGVFATELCSTFNLPFNDQMGKTIDKLWMKLTVANLEIFYSASLHLQATINTRTSKIIDRIENVTANIVKMDLPVVSEERMAKLYTLATCDKESTIRCLSEDCFDVFNSKNSLCSHMKKKHNVVHFKCGISTNGSKCPFASKTWLGIAKHKIRCHQKTFEEADVIQESLYDQTRNAYFSTHTAVHSPEKPSLETTTNIGDEEEQTTAEATTASSPSTKAVNISIAESNEHVEQMGVSSTSNSTMPSTAPTDTDPESVKERVLVDSDEEDKLALTNEYFILDDPEKVVQQTDNDINPLHNNIVLLPLTEIASPQVGRPSTTKQHCLPLLSCTIEKQIIVNGAVSVEANVTVASDAEDKLDLAKEESMIYLEDFGDDFFSPTNRDEKDETTPIATEISNLLTVPPTKKNLQIEESLVTASATPPPSTITTLAADVYEDIKLHIDMSSTTRAQIQKTKQLSDLLTHITKHLEHPITEENIVMINTKPMTRKIEKYLPLALAHCGDKPDHLDQISITIRLSRLPVNPNKGDQQGETTLPETRENQLKAAPINSGPNSHTVQPLSVVAGPPHTAPSKPQANVKRIVMFPCVSAAINSTDILDFCSMFGEISGFRRTQQEAMVKFTTADANVFVMQHPKVTFSNKSCAVRVSHMRLLHMKPEDIAFLKEYKAKK